jgi:hypothetical protein
MEKDELVLLGVINIHFTTCMHVNLLIALARVSVDMPQLLKRYHNIFSRHALENILIFSFRYFQLKLLSI